MHDLHNLKKMLCEALEEYGRRDNLTQNSLQMIDTLAHACKNVCKVISMCDEGDYSLNRHSSADPMGRIVTRNGSEMARKLRDMANGEADLSMKYELERLADKMESM